MRLNSVVLELLNKRGISDADDIEEFLSDKPQKTYNPSLLDDIEAGVDLILAKISEGARICIYGDYDADGITSTSLLIDVLGNLMPRENLDYYIPSRFEEGYGLNMEAVKSIAERGFDLMITVDCGSVSPEEVKYASELGMDVVVTDHHNITDRMAEGILINPRKPGDRYPFKSLSGCGVAFKLAQMIQKKAGLPKSVLSNVLDLVAIGTVGDIMPLTDENRTMVKYGLKVINSGRRAGLRRLMEAAGLSAGNVDAGNIGYVIVPHLNASGRIEDASQAVRLLTAPEGDSRIEQIVEDLIFKNQERRRLQNETYKACTQGMSEGKTDDFIIIISENAHEGIAGIAAGKIKDAFYRPSVLLTPTGNGEERLLKGTGRSIEGVDLYKLLKSHEELFLKFGGHAGACGFTMREEDFEALKNGLLEDMKKIREENPDIFVRKYNVDMTMGTGDISMELAEQLQRLAPFGNGNPKPVFKLDNVTLSDIRFMGSESQHVRFNACDRDGKYIQCVLFNKAEDYGTSLYVKRPVEIIGSLEMQVWQGVRRLQFITEKIKFD